MAKTKGCKRSWGSTGRGKENKRANISGKKIGDDRRIGEVERTEELVLVIRGSEEVRKPERVKVIGEPALAIKDLGRRGKTEEPAPVVRDLREGEKWGSQHQLQKIWGEKGNKRVRASCKRCRGKKEEN